MISRLVALRESCSRKPCGTRSKYSAGCRCDLCRAANNAYEKRWAVLRATGRGNPLVSAAPAREHILHLGKKGVGYKQVAAVAELPSSIVSAIKAGTRANIRRKTEQNLLAVTAADAADRALVPAGPTWKLIHALLGDGYTKTQLATWLGYTCRSGGPALQVGRKRITLRNASRVLRLYRRIREGRLSR